MEFTLIVVILTGAFGLAVINLLVCIFLFSKKKKGDPSPDGFGFYTGGLGVVLLVVALYLVGYSQVNTRTKHAGAPIRVLADGGEYALKSFTEVNPDLAVDDRVMLILQKKGDFYRYYALDLDLLRTTEGKIIQSKKAFPPYFKVNFEVFLESVGGGDFTKKEVFILCPIDPFRGSS
ncbi:MAG: hypothetical protein KAS02_01985 [Candidatus Pacebacteria bacterium]|nr:hypothetical protein [Candidatus Paceibacterota bacterium]